ncbi:methyltransferase [Sulfuricurvum sp.]|uniref:tRNA1(Val) (adenine(37)-N6)-methyltransferase n=1 Tax=Sulfuricurvum sp. TaxID=2025608 RepID=UPI00198C3603|nr:methyltransferase [Sulfuricurvum sp.]MBD3799513.1 methyltransferase [Campylobacterota bacterium]MBD3806243.1 methyltransferase [Sulfuricurvum sp.]
MLLYQIDGGYCYNTDSILLYGFTSRFTPRGKVLDVGAGSGIVGLLIGRDFPNITLEAVEKQPLYAEFARRNAKINGITYTLHEGDFLEHTPHGSYDWIVSNPPFYHENVSRSENPILHQARYNVHLPIEPFVGKISKLLKSDGEAAICYDAGQFAQLCSACERTGLRVVDVQFVHSKVDRPSALVMLHLKKNSRAMLNVLPPLVTLDEMGYTPIVQAIYDKAKVHSIKCPIT